MCDLAKNAGNNNKLCNCLAKRTLRLCGWYRNMDVKMPPFSCLWVL